jgi:hypothetical protein
MSQQFVLFCESGRLQAARLQLPASEGPLIVAGRRFTPAGSFIHLSHIIDDQKLLLGFVVDPLEGASAEPSWRTWWDNFENREIYDFWQAHLFLANPMPAKWDEDGAFLVGGGEVLSDGRGEYVLVLPDYNGHCFRPGEPTEFWRGFGFEFSQLDISVPA